MRLKAFERLAIVYTYSKRHEQALQTIDQAAPLLKRKDVAIPPRLQACVNGMLACAHARNGEDGKAYLDQASTLLSEKDDSSLVYVMYNKTALSLDTGTVLSLQGESEKALEELSKSVDPKTLTLKTPYSEVGRIEVLNTMAMVVLKTKDKDMEQAIHFWKAGIEAAKALKSEQRFKEALTAYEIMEHIWSDEARIKELRDLTRHW